MAVDMRAMAGAFCLFTAMLALSGCATDTVSFTNASADNPLTVRAYLSKPDQEGTFPAVMLLHGCTGLERDAYSTSWRALNAHAGALTKAGFVTLIVDSHGSRGYTTKWSWRNSCDRNAGLGERFQDAFGAIRYLESLPYVRKGEIGAVGFSQGGRVVINALRETERRYHKRHLAAGVAFYPPCHNTNGPFHSPLLILIGEADDITSAVSCEFLVSGEEMRMEAERVNDGDAQGVLPELIVYPETHHSFDLPLEGVVATPIGTVAPDRRAKADARKRMISFFQKHLGS